MYLTLGQIAHNLVVSLADFQPLIRGTAILFGFLTLLQCASVIRHWKEPVGEFPRKRVLGVYLVVAICMINLDSAIASSRATLYGDAQTQTTAEGIQGFN